MTEQNYKIRLKIEGSEIEVEGDKNFVDEKFSFLLKEIRLKLPTPILAERKLVGGSDAVHKDPSTVIQKPNIKVLIAEKKPSGFLQTAVVIAYYLLKYEGKETFIDEDLREIWIASGCKPSKKLPQVMIDCKLEHGWFDRVSRGKYKITDQGIYLVEAELPSKK
jgi:hypothetical protein